MHNYPERKTKERAEEAPKTSDKPGQGRERGEGADTSKAEAEGQTKKEPETTGARKKGADA
jgi:hypothetical protein